MDLHDVLRRFYFTDRPSGYQRLIRGCLLPFVPLYASARSLHQQYRRFGRTEITTPVVSVGNLSLGGTGKTAFSLEVLGLLRDLGLRPGLLKRGEGDEEGIPAPETRVHDLARRYGDEVAVYRFRNPDLPIGVGTDRVALARVFDERSDVDVLLLDDGFQYRQLVRDLNIVLLTPSDVRNNWQLPAGPLRESLSSLERADCVSVKTEQQTLEALSEDLTCFLDSGTPLLSHHYKFRGIYRDGEAVTDRLRGEELVLVSTLARPDELEAFLEENGVSLSEHFSLPDHAELSHQDFRREIEDGRLVMTEKEAVKLPRSIRRRVGIIRSDLAIDPLKRLRELLRDLSNDVAGANDHEAD